MSLEKIWLVVFVWFWSANYRKLTRNRNTRCIPAESKLLLFQLSERLMLLHRAGRSWLSKKRSARWGFLVPLQPTAGISEWANFHWFVSDKNWCN